MKYKSHNVIFSVLLISSTSIYAGTPAPPPPLDLFHCNDLSSNVSGGVLSDAEGCTEVSPGNTVIDGDSLRNSVGVTTNAIGSGIQAGLNGRRTGGGTLTGLNQPRYSGLAAGDSFNNVSVWGSFTRTHADDDLVSTAYSSTSRNSLFGVDFMPMKNMILGIAVSYESSDVDTDFNRGSQDIDGLTFAPYIGYSLSDSLSVDVSIGYSNIDIDQTRTDSVTNTQVLGNTDSRRWFISGGLNTFTSYQDWFLSGRLGLTYASEKQDGYSETGAPTAILNKAISSQTVNFGQLQVGGEAAYPIGNFEPFFSTTYEYDFNRQDVKVNAGQAQPNNDDDDLRLGLGLRYFSEGGFSGILQWDTVLNRTDYDSHSINVLGRFEF